MLILAVLAALAVRPPSVPTKPAKSPAVFVADERGLTFKSPTNSTYCPVPDDWSGSDHGTIVFLTPPLVCDGVGYPSVARGFAPQATPLIMFEYELWDPDVETHAPCRVVGRVVLFGKSRPVCRTDAEGAVQLSVSGRYRTYAPFDLIITLVTSRARLPTDRIAFAKLAASTRACSSPWTYPNGKRGRIGAGPQCPKGRWF